MSAQINLSESAASSEDLGKLYEQYRAELRRYFRRRARRIDSVDDLMQATYVQLLGRSPSEAIREPLRYLFGIARHVLLNDYRRGARDRESLRPLAESSAHAEVSTAWWMEDDSSTALVQEQIESALRQLPRACQAAFILQHRDRRTYKEIAAELNVTEHAVKKYIVKALAHIRLQLNAAELERKNVKVAP